MDATAITAVGALAVSALAAVLTFRTSGQANNVNERANELSWVKELRQDAVDTRRDMESCREEVHNLRRQLGVVTREAEHWITEYAFLHRTVWRPGVTVERLRELLGPPPPE